MGCVSWCPASLRSLWQVAGSGYEWCVPMSQDRLSVMSCSMAGTGAFLASVCDGTVGEAAVEVAHSLILPCIANTKVGGPCLPVQVRRFTPPVFPRGPPASPQPFVKAVTAFAIKGDLSPEIAVACADAVRTVRARAVFPQFIVDACPACARVPPAPSLHAPGF